MQLTDLGIAALQEKLQSKEISSVELIRAYLDRRPVAIVVGAEYPWQGFAHPGDAITAPTQRIIQILIAELLGRSNPSPQCNVGRPDSP